MKKLRKVVVVGREGQLARALIAQWGDPTVGVDLVVLARPTFDLLRATEIAAAIEGLKPDFVVNAAAYTAVDKAEDEPELAHAVNATAPGIIAAAAARVGAPIIHISTDYVFDGSLQRPYLETDQVAPLGVYGTSKLAGELAVAKANPAHVVLRTAWVCSPDGQNFLKTMLRLGRERAALRVVDDQHGAPTFARDLATAINKIAIQLAQDNSAAPFGVFHLAGEGETTWCGFARAIMTGALARDCQPMAQVEAISTAEYPTKARRPAYSKLATGKIASAYGVVMPDWRQGLDVCLDTLIGPVKHITEF